MKMMKVDDKQCILSIKYAILDTSNGEKTEKTEMEHFFIASDKSRLLKKIKSFETKLLRKPKPNFIQRKMAYVQHFLKSWRYTHNSMLKI